MIRVLLVTLLFTSIVCDLPVHCVKKQIVGQWKLSLSQSQMNGMGPLSCGHDTPDRQETSLDAGQQDFVEASSFQMTLSDDNSVSVSGDDQPGRWTMVYDEGFEIMVRNTKYFAFSKYQHKGRNDYDSLCGETLIGWYNNMDTGDRGCYRAQKAGQPMQPSENYDLIKVVQPEFIEQVQGKLHKGFTDHHLVVEDLNKDSKRSWKAKVHPEFVGMSIKELNSIAGRRQYHQKKSESFVEVSSPKHSSFFQSDVSDLPQQHSWDEYLVESRQQQRCGSCYAIATMAMLSMKLKIQGENVVLSPQHSVDCNYYNQGCDGGYPFLVEKYFSENNLVSESDYPYKAATGKCKDVNMESAEKVYQAKNYRYVGGAYGKTNEREMMEELYNNGPVVINFEPAYDFMTYGGGVYYSVPNDEWSGNGYGQPEWEKVDHSVLCYGWGEQDGEKYWLMQNSWGKDWGENGGFRMRRGVDESACESMSETADAVIVNRKGKGNSSFLQADPELVMQNQHLKK